MEQTKALNALEPFLALSKSANSPRAAADLVARATSAQNTFVFAELLQTPQIAALASSPDTLHHYTLLEIFSHGTYQDYLNTPGLPALSDVQTLKLRQLSLMSLARDRNNLSYDVLKQKLALDETRQLEEMVITAIYAGLLTATLDPARQKVQVNSVAPLRDLSPNAIPEMTDILKHWSSRCTSTLNSLESQILSIRCAAVNREREKAQAEEKIKVAAKDVALHLKYDRVSDGLGDAATRKQMQIERKAFLMGEGGACGTMDLDPHSVEKSARASKRKM